MDRCRGYSGSLQHQNLKSHVLTVFNIRGRDFHLFPRFPHSGNDLPERPASHGAFSFSLTRLPCFGEKQYQTTSDSNQKHKKCREIVKQVKQYPQTHASHGYMIWLGFELFNEWLHCRTHTLYKLLLKSHVYPYYGPTVLGIVRFLARLLRSELRWLLCAPGVIFNVSFAFLETNLYSIQSSNTTIQWNILDLYIGHALHLFFSGMNLAPLFSGPSTWKFGPSAKEIRSFTTSTQLNI